MKGTVNEERRTRRWPRRVAWTAVFVVALAAAAWFERSTVIAPFVMRRIAAKLRDEHELELEVAKVSGDWLEGAELEGVVLSKLDGSFRVRAASLDVRYSLVKLWRGEPDSISAALAHGVEIAIDRTKRVPSATVRAPFVWPEHLPAIELTDASAEVVFKAGRSLALEGLALHAERNGEALAVRATNLRFDDARLGRREGKCALRGAFRRGKLSIDELDLDGAPFARDATVDLEHALDGRIAWTAKLALCDGTLATEGSLDATHVESRLAASAIDLASFQHLSRGLFDLQLSGRADFDGKASLSTVAAGGFEVDGSVRSSALSVRGVNFDSLAGDVRLDATKIELARLTVARGKNHAELEDVSMPLAEPDLAARLHASRGRVAIDFEDVPSLLASDARELHVPAHELRVHGSLSGDVFAIDTGSIVTPSGSLSIASGRLQWGADADHLLSAARIELDGRADFTDLAELGALVSTESWCGSARGAVHLAGGWRDLVGSVDLQGENVVANGIPLGDLELAATVDSKTLDVARLEAHGEWGDLYVKGDFSIADRRFEHVTADVRVRAGSPIVPAFFERGAIQIGASIDGELSAPRVEFSLSAADVTVRDRLIDQVEARGVWQGDRVRFDHASARVEKLELVATGELSSLGWKPPFEVALESLHAERESSSLDLVAPTSVRIGSGVVDFDHMNLAGSAGRLIAACHWQPEHVALAVELHELATMGLFASYLPQGVNVDGLHGNLEILLAGDDLTAAADLAIERARLETGGADYAVKTRFDFGAKRLTVHTLELTNGDRRTLEFSGAYPLDPRAAEPLIDGELEARGRLDLANFDELPFDLTRDSSTISGAGTIDFELGGTWRAPRGTIAIALQNAAFAALALQGGEQLGPFDVSANVRIADGIVLDSLHVADGDRARLDLHGDVGWKPDFVALAEHAKSTLDSISLALDGELAADDLGFAARMSPAVRRSAGKLVAKLALGGTLAKPSWKGDLALDDGEIHFASDAPTMSKLRARVTFDGYRASVDELGGEIGSGPFTGSGSIDLEHAMPSLDLKFAGQEILLVRGEGLRLRADAKLDVRGAWDALKIGGELKLRDGRYTRKFDLLNRVTGVGGGAPATATHGIELPRLVSAPLATAEFDIDVRSTDPIRIDNNVARSSLRPELRLRGTGERLELTGPIFVDESRIYLPLGSVSLTGGTIFLKRDNPIVPELELAGAARMMGYDINVRISGTTEKPEITLSSTPPLSSSDLLVLVLTGRPPASTASATGAQAAQSVAVYLGQDLLSRWISRDDDSEPLMDRIEWQQGREVTKSGGQTTEVAVRLTSDDPGKRRILYLQGEKDIYDRINYGVKVLFRFP